MFRSHRRPLLNRREWLNSAACGIGGVALAHLLAQQGRAADPAARLDPRLHHSPRAKRVIFLFMQGGPSQVDLFDYKPKLVEAHGQPIPFELDSRFKTVGTKNTKLFAPIGKFNRAGESGMWMSEHLPHLARQADKLCVLKACETDTPAHPTAVQQWHTGSPTLVRPSFGAWLNYGLGSENESLPGFVTVDPVANQGGARNYGTAFLPAQYQGTPIEDGRIPHLTDSSIPPDVQRDQLGYILEMNRRHAARAGEDDRLDGLIRSFELAFRMQSTAPEIMDLSRETRETQARYGIGGKETDDVGRKLLMARRLSEAGVRFVQVTVGGWDHHGGIAKRLPELCRRVDQPIAALLDDLEARGLLDETLVYWSGEFGRTPFDQDLSEGKGAPANYGRGHHSLAYAAWMAGGGIRGGTTYGETDEFGYRGIAGRTHLHDLHATILHLLGLDHEQLTYRYAGRDFRLTDVYGHVVREALA